MKSLIAAAGVLALSASAAFAQPLSAQMDDGYATPQAYGEPAFGERSLPTDYQAVDAGSVAPGFSPQNDDFASDVTPNLGAGVSRTSDANQG
jgi:hypothetical protein